ncbi:unnamed protein product [Ectocarpus sp. 12 AP-2014]
MAISNALVAIVGLALPYCRAFMSTPSAPTRTCHHSRSHWHFESGCSSSRSTLTHPCTTTRSCDPPAASLANEDGRADVLDVLFGGSYQERIEIGREAQGYLTTDALAARTLVPPRELTYGEYDLDFFLSLVAECLNLRAGKSGNDDNSAALEAEARSLVFGDIGSGCGRLVVAQALTWPWKSCRGVEIVPSLHDMGQAALQEAARVAKGDENALSPETLRLLRSMAPCSLSLGDVNDDVDISDIDVLFCYSSSFPAFGDLLTEFSYTLGHKLRPGAQVITTDRRLVSDGPWEFALLGEREGRNSETGGKSIAYIWEVVRSAL